MRVAIHQPHYMPWLGYLRKIKEADIFVYLDDVEYTKNSFINRNRILINEEKHWLTVPVMTKGESSQQIRHMKVCNDNGWRAKHFKSLFYNYRLDGKEDALREFYAYDSELLIDWCVRSVSLLCDAFGIRTERIFASSLINVQGTSTERLVNICKALGADSYLSGAGVKDYIDINLFDNIDFKHTGWRPNSDLSALHFYLSEKTDTLEEAYD